MTHSFPGGIRRFGKSEWDSSAAAELQHSPFAAYEMPEADGERCIPSVSEGDLVLRGQIIGRNGGDKLVPVLSAVSGRVEAVSKAGTVIIRSDGEMREEEPLSPLREEIMRVSPQELIGIIRDAAIPESGSDRLALARFLDRNAGKLRDVFLNCAEPDPGSCTFSYLAESFPEEIAGGFKILLRILGIGKGTVLLPAEDFSKSPLRSAVRNSRILRAERIKGSYPACNPRLIVPQLTGKGGFMGRELSDDGCAVFTPDTCLAVYYACTCGQRQTDRLLTVAGDCVKKPAVLLVGIGTGCRDAAEKAGPREVPLRLLSGFSPLSASESGRTGGAAVRRNTAVIYALSRRACGEGEASGLSGLLRSLPDACIGCGRCTDICPVSLIPSRLYRYAELVGEEGMQEAFLRLDGVFCIGCGCCTYVCPSSLPLARELSAARELILKRAGEAGDA